MDDCRRFLPCNFLQNLSCYVLGGIVKIFILGLTFQIPSLGVESKLYIFAIPLLLINHESSSTFLCKDQT